MTTNYHQEPLYYSYAGGYDTVTKCRNCGRISLYEDAHPVTPCYQCGGKVNEHGAGRWIKPVKKWNWSIFWFETIEEGYWLDANGKKVV